jgi:hypothetical protein
VSPPVAAGGRRMVVELVPDPVGNAVVGTPVPVPAVSEEMMLEIKLSRPVDDAVGVSVEVLGANVVVAPVPVPVPVGSGIIPLRMDDRRPPSDVVEGSRVWKSASLVSVEEEAPVSVAESVGVVVAVGSGARTPLEPKTPLGAVIPSVADEGEMIGSKIEDRPRERVGRTINGGFTDETPEAVVAAALEAGAWGSVVVIPSLTTTVLEMMIVLTTPGATPSTEVGGATDATGAPVSGAAPPVKTPRRSPRRSRFVEELEESSTELDVVLEISRLTCRGK